jgi:Glyoxalase-like domain
MTVSGDDGTSRPPLLRQVDCVQVPVPSLLQTERPHPETDFLVDSADEAARRIQEAGGRVLDGPRDIPAGRLVVVADPFGNPLVLLDLSKGRFVTDSAGIVTGVSP